MSKQMIDFVQGKSGRLLVSLKTSGISPMVALVDGLSMSYFPDNKRKQYLLVSDVAKWFREEAKTVSGETKELYETLASRYENMLDQHDPDDPADTEYRWGENEL